MKAGGTAALRLDQGAVGGVWAACGLTGTAGSGLLTCRCLVHEPGIESLFDGVISWTATDKDAMVR